MLTAVDSHVQRLSHRFAISWAFARFTAQSQTADIDFAVVLVLFAGSVEGHLIIV